MGLFSTVKTPWQARNRIKRSGHTGKLMESIRLLRMEPPS
jgi:hypothetical protein